MTYQRVPEWQTSVIDLKGLSHRHYHPSLILMAHKLAHPLQLHYPYMVKKVLIINASAIFRFVWALFKPFVFPHLRALMEVAPEGEETEQLLSEYIDLQVLPEIIVPGKGQGKPVPGLSPDWEAQLLPPPRDDDWERIPFVYGPSEKTLSLCKVQTTVLLTGTWTNKKATKTAAIQVITT
jgi:hypothetical protein